VAGVEDGTVVELPRVGRRQRCERFQLESMNLVEQGALFFFDRRAGCSSLFRDFVRTNGGGLFSSRRN
jgi:hypothetical protein